MSTKILRGPKQQYCPDQTIGEFFIDRAERFGDRICQVDATVDKEETYSSVKTRSVRVALALRKKGITPRDVVVLCSTVTLDSLIPIVASFLLGSKITNLDPTLSKRQISHLLSLVAPKIIIVQAESVSLIEESLESASVKAEIVVFEDSSRYATFGGLLKPQSDEDDFEPVKVSVHDTAIIFFSSGTTGLPKAICHSHFSFLNVARSFYDATAKGGSFLSFASFYWISAHVLLIASFIAGGRRVFTRRFVDAEQTFSIIEKYRVTTLFLAPIFTYELTNFGSYHKYDTSSLRTMILGGTPMSTAQLQRVKTTFKHADVIFGYGCTEGGVLTVFNPITDKQIMEKKLGSCGKAAPGVTIKVVDISTNTPLGPNERGEIRIKTLALMTGYYNVDSTSAFDSEGFLKTGDVGYYDEDGCFYVVERLKEMFKYMTWHVVPSSVESVLLEHPSVKEAVVFGVPLSAEEGQVPTACVVLKEGCTADKKEIEEFVAGRVADHERLRGGVIFVEDLRKTPSGKLMRKDIRSAILQTL